MKIKKFEGITLLFCIVMFTLTGCSALKTPAVNMVDMKSTDFSTTMKRGQSCQNYILGFIGPFGDASMVKAAKNANLSKVEAIEYKDTNYFLLSQKCVCVYGH